MAYRSKLQVVQDLMGGQDAMREAGRNGRYIPRYVGEPEAKWAARVMEATIFNGYERTLAYLCGQVFSKDLRLQGEGGNEQDAKLGAFADLAENIDGEGNSISVWSKRGFHKSLNDGWGILLADSAAVEVRNAAGGGREYLAGKDAAGNEDWRPLTAATDAEAGLRPKLVYVRSENILGWRFKMVGGAKKLVMLRIMETEKVEGEWDAGDEEIPQVRVITPGHWETYQQQGDDKDNWVPVGEGVLPTPNDIPVAIVRLGKPLDDEMTCEPALRALADKNVEHWKKQADHNQLMTWVRSPGMMASGVQEDTELPWGPGVLTKLTDPQGKVEAVGVDAPSVAASRQELEDLKRDMALYGMQLLMPRIEVGDVTATEKGISKDESDSTLKGWAIEWKDALEQALVWLAAFIREQVKAPSVVINTKYRAPLDNASIAKELSDARQRGDISRETWWEIQIEAGVLPDDFDFAEERARLEADNRQQAGPSGAGSLADKILGAGNPTASGQPNQDRQGQAA
ncbi:MAG: DUF4055 domain-containing protein [Desulfovibrio sp.]